MIKARKTKPKAVAINTIKQPQNNLIQEFSVTLLFVNSEDDFNATMCVCFAKA